jgi:hypothetical protein
MTREQRSLLRTLLNIQEEDMKIHEMYTIYVMIHICIFYTRSNMVAYYCKHGLLASVSDENTKPFLRFTATPFPNIQLSGCLRPTFYFVFFKFASSISAVHP